MASLSLEAKLETTLKFISWALSVMTLLEYTLLLKRLVKCQTDMAVILSELNDVTIGSRSGMVPEQHQAII